MRQKKEDYPMRVKLLQIALELYLENGFTLTTNQMIVSRAKCSPGEITHFFGTKENILCEVVKMVLPIHQDTLAEDSADLPEPVRYCMEIAVELAMCEQSKTVRDLYVNAYSLPGPIEFIRGYSYKKSIGFFSSRLPDWTEQDFYETEALTMGIVFGSLMDQCTPRYNLRQKLSKVLDALLKIYEFSEAEREQTVKAVLSMDIAALAAGAETHMRNAVEKNLHKSGQEAK